MSFRPLLPRSNQGIVRHIVRLVCSLIREASDIASPGTMRPKAWKNAEKAQKHTTSGFFVSLGGVSLLVAHLVFVELREFGVQVGERVAQHFAITRIGALLYVAQDAMA